MNSLPDTPRLSKTFYTKMSATATKQFSEEMQKRRKPFLLSETEPINARISIKKSNKENTLRASSPYNKPAKNSINTTPYRTTIDYPVLHKYHHNSSKPFKEIKLNSKATYPDSPGKIEIENIPPIKTNCVANETVPIGNYQGKTSIDLYQAPTKSKENQKITSDVEQLLKMHKEMTEMKQKLEEKYKTTLKHRCQLIKRTPGTETDNIMAENEAQNSHKITATNMHDTSELLTTTTLLSLAKASGIESRSQECLSLITDEPCNAKGETLNETVKLFTKLQTFIEVSSKETLIAAETGNSKRETLIRKINLLRHVMLLTSKATAGYDTSDYQSLTEEDFNNYKIEHVTNSTPLTATAEKVLEASGIETDGVSFESITNSSLFATMETVESEICNKINSTAVKEEAPTETSGNETARSQSLFALNEALKNAKTLAENLESLTNIIGSCNEEINGIETNSSKSLSPLTKGQNKFDIESINRCLEQLINEFLNTTQTNGIETTGHNLSFCKETKENEMNCKEMNNIEEKENLNTVLNFLKTILETSGYETAKWPISQEEKENKKEYNCEKNKDLQALQITIPVKETNGIETPRFLTQLISRLNKAQNETPQSLKTQSRLKRNFPFICNKIKTISQIPNEIIKIPKKYLTYRAQNAENSCINKENGNEAMANQGNDGEKGTSKGARLKLKIPNKCLHNLKSIVSPKRCMKDAEQKERYEMEHFKQIERKGPHHLREGAKNKPELPGECGPKHINVEQYGGMLYGLWDAVKNYPFEAQEEQLSNRAENRKMNIENKEDKREDQIKEREKKCEKNEGENVVQQSEIIAKKDSEKQEVMPKGNEFPNGEKIPKKKYSFRKSLRNYFTKEEKTNPTDAKNLKEDCAKQENDTDERYEID